MYCVGASKGRENVFVREEKTYVRCCKILGYFSDDLNARIFYSHMLYMGNTTTILW